MELLQLTYFKKVAELQHMSKAAAELFITQPSLSQTIALLERELGVKLFERVGKNIRLNSCGEILLKYATRILNDLEDAKQEIEQENGQLQHNVNISIVAGTRMIPKIILGFKDKFPEININITQEHGDMDIEEGCDLYLYSSTKPIESSNATVVLKEECVLGLPNNHPLANQKEVSIADLEQETFFLLQDKKPLSDITIDLCHQAGFTPHIGLICDNYQTLLLLIENGLGVCIFPSSTWQEVEQTRNIMLVQLPQQPYRYLILQWRKRRPLNPSALKLKEFLIELFQEMQE